jgi:hypothetical protein
MTSQFPAEEAETSGGFASLNVMDEERAEIIHDRTPSFSAKTAAAISLSRIVGANRGIIRSMVTGRNIGRAA